MAYDHRKSVTHRLGQAARATRLAIGGELSRLGLHAGQESVLKALAERDGRSMSELAMELGVQPPTVTKMVTRLAAQGYVERRASEGDARQAHVHLTAQGSDAVAEVDRLIKRVERQALGGIADKDRRRLRKLLRRVERNFDKARAERAVARSREARSDGATRPDQADLPGLALHDAMLSGEDDAVT